MCGMYGIEILKVAGIEEAIIGMRNPMNSWIHSDTEDDVIGERDLALAKNLIKNGSEHAKFLRQIHVWMDVKMPRYFWQEFDQYHFNVTQSTSTMHRLFEHTKPIALDSFVFNPSEFFIMDEIVKRLNGMREVWLVAKEEKNVELMNEMLISAKRILPEGYLQLRTVSTNYAELINIYKQRVQHRLPEWKTFCNAIEMLPYMKEFLEV